MTRYRLVKKRNKGYEPYYEIQKRILGFIWVLCSWSTSWDKIHDEYERILTADERPEEFLVLTEDVV